MSSSVTTNYERYEQVASTHLPPVRLIIGDEERTDALGGVVHVELPRR